MTAPAFFSDPPSMLTILTEVQLICVLFSGKIV